MTPYFWILIKRHKPLEDSIKKLLGTMDRGNVRLAFNLGLGLSKRRFLKVFSRGELKKIRLKNPDWNSPEILYLRIYGYSWVIWHERVERYWGDIIDVGGEFLVNYKLESI